MFFQNELGRNLARRLYRVKARAMLLGDGPRIFVNSLPKAGTHLLTGVLDAVDGISSSGLHIETRKINTLSKSKLQASDFSLDAARFSSLLSPIRAGQYVSCHLRFDQAAIDILTELDFKQIFIIRDPRDVLVSLLYYVKGLKRHPMHKLLVTEYANDEQRLIALLKGENRSDPSLNFVGFADQLKMYAQWVQASQSTNSICLVKFEDLVSRKNADESNRLTTIANILDYLDIESDNDNLVKVSESAKGKKSFTFRKGASGEWSDVFSPLVKQEFNNDCADLLEIYGYEKL